jgi:release factor glutamine methyltransferase
VISATTEATIGGLLRDGRAALASAAIDTARTDAEWLLAAVLGVDRLSMYLETGRAVSADVIARFRALIERRATREPLQYLTEFEEFHGLRLAVTPDVLIPRQETEGLVRWAIEVLAEEPAPLSIDVGTGSGAIACALADALPRLKVLAIERSIPAIAVASHNVHALGLDRRVMLLGGDLLEPLGPIGPRLHLVIANPPYIPSAVVPTLPAEVAHFEPRDALDGGPDGLAVSRRIVATAPSILRRGGWLMMEIGDEQAGPLASLMASEGFTGIQARRDLAGVERYIAGQWAEASASARRVTC